ncbi:MAG: dienelactone hydrolase family protein [Acidimicrobiia bacterium]|nr:dienelactone hydrolase family protein [Acidimicrobiia bacterium]
MTQLTASDGHQLDSYEVHPDRATAAVVIVQEIFGVNSHVRSVVDRYASFGYRAIAPAMFDRVERGVELDYTAEGVEQGRSLRQKLSWDDSVLDVAAGVEHVSGTGAVAVIGYCYGGSMAWLAAASLPIAAAVGYYGGQVIDFIDRTPQVPTMLHFGALDQAIPLDGVHTVAERHPDVIVHVYDDAGHGFNCDVRASYHADAAALAEERTREFLALHL